MKHFASRLLQHIFEGVEKTAKEDTRSINGQINVLLTEALDARKLK